MKTKMNLNENITWNFIKRMLYAFQVILIAMAIPLLSYMEMTHGQKDESPSVKNSSVTKNPDATVLTLKELNQTKNN